MKKRLFSGIQPSGQLHLGNYLGAIRQWVDNLHEVEGLYCIVDLHSMTVRQDPTLLRQQILQTAAVYIACGLDPKENVLFVQSHVPAHTQLAWMLSTFTHMGELERMTQFKEKAAQHRSNINAGLFTYPILMAADILLYQPDGVPVGEDQKQHVELARNIAERVNKYYHQQLFKIPQVLLQKHGARIMGLDDPAKKMSKSAASPWNSIALTDDADTIRKKIRKAVTDSGSEIIAGPEKPAMTNLLTIFSLVSGLSIAVLEKKYADSSYANFKNDLADAVIEHLRPLQEKMADVLGDPTMLHATLRDGRERADQLAQQTLRRVAEVSGLLLPEP